jgi:hypothetical protein
MLKLKLAALASAALLLTTTTTTYAHDIDDCVLEKTYECLDDADFWGCYDFILEGCQGHGQPHAQADLNKLKAKARIILKNSLTMRN